jgi:hypothetical protein
MFKLIQLLRRHTPDTDWEWHETLSGPVMRRRRDGKWEVRPMTPDELLEYKGSRCGW